MSSLLERLCYYCYYYYYYGIQNVDGLSLKLTTHLHALYTSMGWSPVKGTAAPCMSATATTTWKPVVKASCNVAVTLCDTKAEVDVMLN
jgi:hypothetical protein